MVAAILLGWTTSTTLQTLEAAQAAVAASEKEHGVAVQVLVEAQTALVGALAAAVAESASSADRLAIGPETAPWHRARVVPAVKVVVAVSAKQKDRRTHSSAHCHIETKVA